MVRIWKIGAWPGLRVYGNVQRDKRMFIEDYALPYGFVAIGFGWVSNLRTMPMDLIIKELMAHPKTTKSLSYYSSQLKSFRNKIKQGDIVLLYNRRKVYVGRVNKEYYYVERGMKEDVIQHAQGYNYAPHRIGVDWLFKQRTFSADFSHWQDTIHEVTEDSLLGRMIDNELKNFILQKLSE